MGASRCGSWWGRGKGSPNFRPRDSSAFGNERWQFSIPRVGFAPQIQELLQILGHGTGLVERRPRLLNRHLEKQQKRELLDVVAVGQTVIAECCNNSKAFGRVRLDCSQMEIFLTGRTDGVWNLLRNKHSIY